MSKRADFCDCNDWDCAGYHPMERSEKRESCNMTSSKNDPRTGSVEPAASRSRLRRLKAQLENPDLSPHGRDTLERVIRAMEKKLQIEKLLKMGDDGEA